MNPPPTASETTSGVDQAHWFAEKVQPHEPALRAWLRSQYPSLRDVDDIVQESYLRPFRAREVGKVDYAKAYLFGIARYVVMGVFRKERFISKIPVNELSDSGTLEANGSVLETVSVRQELVLAADAIKTLPGRCREIVILHALHGM